MRTFFRIFRLWSSGVFFGDRCEGFESGKFSVDPPTANQASTLVLFMRLGQSDKNQSKYVFESHSGIAGSII